MPSKTCFPREQRIGIAGSGRMASALGRLLVDRGHPLVAIAGRDPSRVRAAAIFCGYEVDALPLIELPGRVGSIIVAVADDAIGEVAAILAQPDAPVGIALHTCGARGPDVLAPLARLGTSCATFHPLQTVALPEQGVADLPGVTFGTAGDPRAVEWADGLARSLGGRVLRLAPEHLPLYHAAAVMASNYVVALVDGALALLEAAGVDRRDGLRALGPLLRTSASNAATLGPEQALTGPVRRGDIRTLSAHQAVLQHVPDTVRDLYVAAARQVLDLAARQGLPENVAHRVAEVLDNGSGKRNPAP